MSNRIFLIIVILLQLPVSGFAQNSMIRGKVRASNGNTITDALVELKQSTGGLVGQSATRSDGDFVFSGLRAGNYEVVVTLAGYETTSQTVQLGNNMVGGRASSDNPGEVVIVEIRLKPKSDTALGLPGTTFAQNVPSPAREAFEKGVAKIRDGKPDEGMAFLREATEKFSDYFDAYLALGVEYYRQGKDNEALQSLERARSINERGAGVYYMFGMIMVRQQKFRVAEYAFWKATELNGNYTLAHFNHGVALIEVALRTKDTAEVTKFLTEADKEMDRAWELSSKRMNTIFLQRARIQQARGDNEAAARELENYLKAEPDAKNAAALKETIKQLRENKETVKREK